MKIIAYKIANNIKSKVTEGLPPTWITEYTNVDDHPEDSLLESDGWQFMLEDEFNILFVESNSDAVYKEYYDAKNAKDFPPMNEETIAAWKLANGIS